MRDVPYQVGDVIHLEAADGATYEAVVSSVVATEAADSRRRWRLLCRWGADGSFIDAPIYCGDDGDTHVTGELRIRSAVRRAIADPSRDPTVRM